MLSELYEIHLIFQKIISLSMAVYIYICVCMQTRNNMIYMSIPSDWKYILCLIEIEIYISILLKFYQIAYKY